MSNETAAAAETAAIEILPPEGACDMDAVRGILAGELMQAHRAIIGLVDLIRHPDSSFDQANIASLAAANLMRGTAQLALALSKLSGEAQESRQRISVEYLGRFAKEGEGVVAKRENNS